jgi:hypothetical protein
LLIVKPTWLTSQAPLVLVAKSPLLTVQSRWLVGKSRWSTADIWPVESSLTAAKGTKSSIATVGRWPTLIRIKIGLMITKAVRL